MISDAEIIAYADGELKGDRRRAVEAAAAEESDVAAKLAAHSELRQAAQRAFADVLDEPLPERLLHAIRGAEVVRPSFGEGRRFQVAKIWTAAGGALAASVALGFFLGQVQTEGAGFLRPSSGGLVAGGQLAAALDRRLSTEKPGAVQVGFTFARQDGALCRTFTMNEEALAGLACREGEQWGVPVLAKAAVVAGSEYRTASSAVPPEILAGVDARIAGEAFSIEQEKAARARKWSR